MSIDWAKFTEITPEKYSSNFDKAILQRIYNGNTEKYEFEKNYHHSSMWGSVCKRMTEDIELGIKDQQEYILEIEDIQVEIESLQEEQKNKIENLYSEIEELKNKEKNGTITNEEKKDLDNKTGEFSTITRISENQLNDLNNDLQNTQCKAIKQDDIINTAQKWGQETVEAAENVLNDENLEQYESTTKMTRTVDGVTTEWSYREGAELALERGEDLLEKTNEYSLNQKFFED